MSLADMFLNEVTEEKTAENTLESRAQYFDLMGKAAAHGYHDAFNGLLNEVDAGEAVDLVEKSAGAISPEFHKLAEDLIEGEDSLSKEALSLEGLKGRLKGLPGRLKGLPGRLKNLSDRDKMILAGLAGASAAGAGYATYRGIKGRKTSKKRK